jgi:hypothetical protein
VGLVAIPSSHLIVKSAEGNNDHAAAVYSGWQLLTVVDDGFSEVDQHARCHWQSLDSVKPVSTTVNGA